ncbi:MAG: hypothetical protein IJ572_00615 [Bacilli bacterium]|nr:hypothetical protein [Bacilli bacterium]
MKKYKGLIIFVLLLGVYGLVMYFIFNEKNTVADSKQKENKTVENKTSQNDYYLVIGNSSFLKYQNNSFVNTSLNSIENVNLFKVFIDNKYFGNYKLKYGGDWNLFNDKEEYVNYEGNLLAASSNLEFTVKNFSIREINDEDKIYLINNYNLNTFNYLTSNQVVDIDLDSNGQIDEIICLSSMEESESINNYYSLLIIKLNGKYHTLIDERGENSNYVYEILSVVNFFNNMQDSIIVSRLEGYISENPKTTNLIVNYKNNNYTID